MFWLEAAFPRLSNKWTDFRTVGDGAVVVINGAAYLKDVRDMHQLNDDLRNFQWVLLVSIGDEGSGQHLEWIDHPKSSIWVFDPKPGKHDNFHRLPAGPLQSCQQFLLQFPSKEKPRDWFFSGSVRDAAWDAAIHSLPVERGGLCPYHLGQKEYIQCLTAAKIVPCRPSWTSPETCRLYDALEAGCIPIVGVYPSENPPGHRWWRDSGFDWLHYWEYIFGERPPFPIIENAAELESVFQNTLDNWHNNAQEVFFWWIDCKQKVVKKLQDEVKRLQQL